MSQSPHASRRTPRSAHRGAGVVALAAVILVLAVPRVGRAEIVVMRTGSRIACSRAVPDNQRMRLELAGGGVLVVSRADIKRVESGSSAGSQSAVVRASGVPAGSHGDPAIAQSSSRAFDPVLDGHGPDSPRDPEVARARAEAAGRASTFPTVIGAMAGVEPVPMSPQLRNPTGEPQLDNTRRAFAQRARIAPGSAGALLGHANPGGLGTGGGRLDSGNGREAPRVGR